MTACCCWKAQTLPPSHTVLDNAPNMKTRWSVALFFVAFVVFQICMQVAWQKVSSDALLCSIMDPSSIRTMTNTLLNDTITSHGTLSKKRQVVQELMKAGVKPRAFPRKPVPCIVPPDDRWWNPHVLRTPAHEGLLFVKEMKTGSSTMAGVTIRIARNVARRLYNGKYRLCKLRFDHSSALKQEYGKRIKEKSFLFTIIREPTSRAISQFFHFHVSREKVEPTDKEFKKHLLRYPYMDNYYLRDLSTGLFIPGRNDTVTAVNNILSDYDFIGITERLDESLVAMQMILGLQTNDLLYLRAKGNGGYDDAATKNRTCQYIVPSFVSPGMNEFFSSSKLWKQRTKGDLLLYKAADRSLDYTIDALGREEFDKNLQLFRKSLALAEATCTNVRFPCSESGQLNQPTDCLWLDSGCGVNCLDKLPDPTD